VQLVIIENLPDTSLSAIYKEIRDRDYYGPVIVLSHSSGLADKIYAFQLGCDDYLVRPFEPEELLVRVNAILRRTAYGDRLKTGVIIKVHDAELLLSEFTYRSQAVSAVTLTPTEMKMLEYLMRNPKVILTRDQLGERVWGHDFYDQNKVNIYIRRIRKKIEPDPDPDNSHYLHTVRGVGYVFRPEFCETLEQP
jgi:DNA-binding response OmpR family regulator